MVSYFTLTDGKLEGLLLLLAHDRQHQKTLAR
jgi:hypothetical protein